jgi:hypothetical protein
MTLLRLLTCFVFGVAFLSSNHHQDATSKWHCAYGQFLSDDASLVSATVTGRRLSASDDTAPVFVMSKTQKWCNLNCPQFPFAAEAFSGRLQRKATIRGSSK